MTRRSWLSCMPTSPQTTFCCLMSCRRWLKTRDCAYGTLVCHAPVAIALPCQPFGCGVDSMSMSRVESFRWAVPVCKGVRVSALAVGLLAFLGSGLQGQPSWWHAQQWLSVLCTVKCRGLAPSSMALLPPLQVCLKPCVLVCSGPCA